jgi:hypothetical protein
LKEGRPLNHQSIPGPSYGKDTFPVFDSFKGGNMSDKKEQQSKTLDERKKKSRREFFEQFEKGLIRQVEDRIKAKPKK